ncbi:MAG: PQQ-like beta-propeller repeat protein, partial [Planctomycetota bacterium]|nr:PQQ-like beta-propeller repeat protein [Planctomycetota bacterium]
MNGFHIRFINALIGLLLLLPSDAADWPQWRYDPNRSASSPEHLPDRIALLWTRKWPARTPAWENPLNRDKMTFDRHFEPVVMGERMFVAFNDTDRLIALNAETGEEIWTYFADGPIRMPPAGWNDTVFVASDDGYLHGVDAASGKLRWKYRGGPAAQKTLGNRRVISMWPARGGPVVRDGKVYFAAGIWPFLGTFIYALDAASGKVEWINDSTGPTYSMQPHGASAFGGVAPQGALVAAKDVLLVPGGRSLPAAFSRKTGKLSWFYNSGIVGGKGVGGSFVAANDQHLFVHTRKRGVHAFTLDDEKKTKLGFNGEPVLDGKMIFAAGGRSDEAYSNVVACFGPDSWEIEVDGSGDLIRASGRLYAAGADAITAIDLPAENARPGVAWRRPIKGVVRLLAASEKLFAVTL